MKSVDEAFEAFKAISEEANSNLSQLDNEAKTRFHLIDKILKEVLNWDKWDVNPEEPIPNGYVDYLLESEGRGRLVLEAKAIGIKLIGPSSPKCQALKLSGAILKPAKEGLIQAMEYSMHRGVNLACLTSGITWVGFLPSRTDGLSVLDNSKAAVFPNLTSIEENFALFFQLFEKSNVVQKNYLPYFHEIEGKKVSSAVKLYTPVHDARVKMLPSSDLSTELNKIFEEYFTELSNEKDKEMIKECFVETQESKKADQNLKKIMRDLISQIRSEASKKLANEIEDAIETSRGEIVLIVGKKGAGKSTFIDRFFTTLLPRKIKSRCLYLNIDLARFPGGHGLQSWVTKEIKRLIFDDFYGEEGPSYNDLKGVFKKDYDRWAKCEYAPLLKSQPDQFEVEFGKFMAEEARNSPYEYVVRLLKNSILSRKRMPCIVFDNADQFSSSVQEELFQYSESLKRNIPLVFTILPITDKTAWEHVKGGPLESYKSKSYYLPVPATKDVFKKRIEYLKTKLKQSDQKSGKFTTHNGFTVNVENINAFARCIETVFIEKEYISRTLGSLSNYNIRKCLDLAYRAIGSPHLGAEDLINAYLHGNSLNVKSTKIKRAILLGDYKFYKKQRDRAVLNLFEVNQKHLTSPLLSASILALLLNVANSSRDDVRECYLSIDDIETYFEPMGVLSSDIRRYSNLLLDWELIETYNPHEDDLSLSNEVAITHSGKQHLDMLTKDNVYLTQMALRTPIRNEVVSNSIKETYLESKKLSGYRDWLLITKDFLNYCLAEDNNFINIPEHEDYEVQRLLRCDLQNQPLFRKVNNHDRKQKVA